MQKRFLLLASVLGCIVLLNWNCNKPDSTILGQDLIPAVDNVTTFADTLAITAVREQNVDTTQLTRTEIHALGSITNDPVFGKTQANIYVQLKPTSYPFYFGNAGDTIKHFDSAFLCLSITGFYGDTLKNQHFKVYKMDANTTNFIDTVAYQFDYQPTPQPTQLIGDATIYEPSLKNYAFLHTTAKDSVVNQIRIKLDPSFLAEITKGDSTASGMDNFFRTDSLFKIRYKGFAIVADGGPGANGLFYINLADANTRLEVHYVATHGKLDTAFTTLPMSTGVTVTASASANYVFRDTSSAEFRTAPDPNALYVLSAPGTAIQLKIPELSTLSNRIIHRAEIFLDQVPGSPGNDVLTAPQYLYLDLLDDTTSSTLKKYKPIYYDLSQNEIYEPDNTSVFFPASGVDVSYFGGYLRTATGGIGTRSYYSFNITRYVQNLVTKGGINYRMRVYAPYNLTYNLLHFQYKNNIAAGRVKLYNGPDSNYRPRLRIVYSKI